MHPFSNEARKMLVMIFILHPMDTSWNKNGMSRYAFIRWKYSKHIRLQTKRF